MKQILEYFKQITKIPRCSSNTDKMKEFLVNFAKEKGYKVKTDEYGNILATSKNPKVCFQSHYDMVCIGEYKNIEIMEENGFLKAKNSTLGADNGIGIAIMMKLMDKKDLEFLFTNDEEIAIPIPLSAPRVEFFAFKNPFSSIISIFLYSPIHTIS